MDDLLGLNEINTITHCNLNCYFEEEDKKEELYIKMIEDRIMFKIRKEIIEPLISDFNVKTDINMCEILKLKDDVSELKECVERNKLFKFIKWCAGSVSILKSAVLIMTVVCVRTSAITASSKLPRPNFLAS